MQGHTRARGKGGENNTDPTFIWICSILLIMDFWINFHSYITTLVMVAQACNPRILEAEAAGLLQVGNYSGPHTKFQASLGYTLKSHLKNKKPKEKYYIKLLL